MAGRHFNKGAILHDDPAIGIPKIAIMSR